MTGPVVSAAVVKPGDCVTVAARDLLARSLTPVVPPTTWMRNVAPVVRFAAGLIVAVRLSGDSAGEPAAWAIAVPAELRSRTFVVVIVDASIGSLKVIVGSTPTLTPVALFAGFVLAIVGATPSCTANRPVPVPKT